MKTVWKTIGFIVLLLAVYYAVQFFISASFIVVSLAVSSVRMILGSGSFYIGGVTGSIVNSVVSNTPLILMISAAVTFCIYLLFYRKRKADLKSFCRIRMLKPLYMLLLILFGLSLNILLEFILTIFSTLDFFKNQFENYNDLYAQLLGGGFLLSLLGAGILVPVFEEFLFRGLVFGELKKITNVKAALILQAVIFGIYHMNLIQGSYAFIIALALGFLYYKSGSLLAPFLLHITINSSSIVMSRFLTDEMLQNSSAPVLLSSVVLFVFSTAVLLKKANVSNRKIN